MWVRQTERPRDSDPLSGTLLFENGLGNANPPPGLYLSISFAPPRNIPPQPGVLSCN